MKVIKNKKIIIAICSIVVLVFLVFGFYRLELNAVDKKDHTNILFVINKGESKRTIVSNLKTANLIRNKDIAYIYSYIHSNYTFKPGTYSLNRTMSVKEIFTSLHEENTKEKAGITLTFKEGKRYTDYVELIANSDLNLTENDFSTLMSDQEYLKSLIKDYWFLTDKILDSNIYYPLEGYLFPDTYNFSYSATAKDIIKVMLDNTNVKISEYRVNVVKSNMDIHQIITLASIVEMEGKDNSDLKGIAGVFINRINSGMSLGSDVTTYYAAKKTFKDDLTALELSDCNAYNTRSSCLKGLPVGPVSNPGIKAIDAAMNPDDNDYLFFVSDKSGKIYFSKTNAEHEQTVAKLKQEGNWYIYE